MTGRILNMTEEEEEVEREGEEGAPPLAIHSFICNAKFIDT